MYRYILYSFIFFTASGCSTLVEHTSVQPGGWENNQLEKQNIRAWTVVGRLGVTTEYQSGTLDLFWKQFKNSYTIRMIAPFGQGTILIKGNKNGVHVRTKDGEHYSDSPDDFIASQLGVPLPLEGLRSWLRGLPMKAATMENPRWDDKGHLYKIVQDGWNVEMSRYKKVDQHTVPHTFHLDRDDQPELAIKMVIRRWKIDPV